MPARILAAWLLLGATLIAPAISSADAASTPGDQPETQRFTANEYRARQSSFTLPFFSMNGHILIDGAVGHQRGKFLFDTGTEFPFFLNNHYLNLAKEKLFGRGHAASGQAMTLYRQSTALPFIEIGDSLRFENVRGFTHTDWNFLAESYGIPAFLGSIGHGFNRNYVFIIDYDVQTITFHAYDQNGVPPAGMFDPAKVVARLEFNAAGVDGKIPEVTMHIGDQRIAAFFDTGNLGTLELTESMKSELEHAGYLSVRQSNHLYGSYEAHQRGDVKGLRHGQQALAEMHNLTCKPGTQNRIGLGYQFLKHYVSVWDYQNRTLTLLSR